MSRPPLVDNTGEASPVIEAAVLHALSQPPTVWVPTDFAARVAERAALLPLTRPSHGAGYGPRLALAGTVALLVALFAFAPHAAPSFTDFRFDLELTLLAELGGMACWFGLVAPRS